MNLNSVNAVLILIAFLVPGFIASSLLATTFRRRSRSASELTLQYLTLSCINYGLWSWLIAIMLYGRWIERHPVLAIGVVFLIIFVSPLILGLSVSHVTPSGRVARLLSAVGFKVHRFIPTAWDYTFEHEEPAWVIVRLKDGSIVYGFWGTESFAGDERGERDLFVEAVFKPANSGHWQPIPDTGGILIKANEIATIEFRRIESD